MRIVHCLQRLRRNEKRCHRVSHFFVEEKLLCAMLKKESKMAVRVNPNGPTRSRALLPLAILGLGLLAAMAGHASAELGCYTEYSGTSNERSYLSDPEYCHIKELNAAFDGLLTGCGSNTGGVRRVCSQMCTHHHPPTPTHTHSVGRACAPLLLLQLSSPPSPLSFHSLLSLC